MTTNILAYCGTFLITAIKSFKESDPKTRFECNETNIIAYWGTDLISAIKKFKTSDPNARY